MVAIASLTNLQASIFLFNVHISNFITDGLISVKITPVLGVGPNHLATPASERVAEVKLACLAAAICLGKRMKYSEVTSASVGIARAAKRKRGRVTRHSRSEIESRRAGNSKREADQGCQMVHGVTY
jgi:hypothetical protein